MTRDLRFATAVLATAALLGSCSHTASTSTNAEVPRQQENFGVLMARQNLWREAMFRFQRAIEINPGDAMAHNNLAVAFEANGDFEKARKEYLEALKLDKGNQYIQKNYSRFVEFTSRNKKRTPAKASSATGSSAPANRQGASATQPNYPPGQAPGDVTSPPQGAQPVTPTAPPGSRSDQPPPPDKNPPPPKPPTNGGV
jgi:Flp pilus assembly protein TadD